MALSNEETQEFEILATMAILRWGTASQEDLLMEECGELITAISQHRRGRIPDHEVLEEIADVMNMLWPVILIHDKAGKFDTIRRAKIARFRERLN
jgi:NTP pyrophosphatase (non-canonical NTP hydrolase)